MIRTLFTAAALLTLLGCGGSPKDAQRPRKTKIITEVPQPEANPPSPPQVYTPPENPQLTLLKEVTTDQLIAKLGDEKERDTAAWALAERGAEAVPALQKALGDKSPQVRAAVVYTLGQCGKHAQGAVAELKRLQEKDDSEVVRDAAAFALDAIEGK